MRSFNISRSFSVELVSAIYVVAPDKSSGKRVQHLHIKCDGPGFITLNELMKKETARTKSRRPLKTYGFQRFDIAVLRLPGFAECLFFEL